MVLFELAPLHPQRLQRTHSLDRSSRVARRPLPRRGGAGEEEEPLPLAVVRYNSAPADHLGDWQGRDGADGAPLQDATCHPCKPSDAEEAASAAITVEAEPAVNAAEEEAAMAAEVKEEDEEEVEASTDCSQSGEEEDDKKRFLEASRNPLPLVLPERILSEGGLSFGAEETQAGGSILSVRSMEEGQIEAFLACGVKGGKTCEENVVPWRLMTTKSDVSEQISAEYSAEASPNKRIVSAMRWWVGALPRRPIQGKEGGREGEGEEGGGREKVEAVKEGRMKLRRASSQISSALHTTYELPEASENSESRKEEMGRGGITALWSRFRIPLKAVSSRVGPGRAGSP